MAVTWTKEQQRVIDIRDRNLLVSAAAGSGKTAVLVERIINRITDEDHPVDIDRLLVVTFTKAAAAQMRERISAAIEKKREEEPDNARLERQQTLIHNAQITTIDSFCLFVVRNHFEDISLDPNFRIADAGEIRLLEQDVLEEVFEQNYGREENGAFLALVDAYSGSKNDTALKEMVSRIYRLSGSNPWPGEWMAHLADIYQADTVEELLQAEPLKEAAQVAGTFLLEGRTRLRELLAVSLEPDGPANYAQTLEQDLELLKDADRLKDYGSMYDFFRDFHMGNLAAIRKFDGDAAKKERVKNGRNTVKKDISDLQKKYFSLEPEALLAQIQRLRPYIQELVRLGLEYRNAMMAKKREKRMADFNDIEHFALNIFVDENTKELRPAAQEFRNQFAEIMIDEYQDSNQVQESIMQAICREPLDQHNLFMVGDVKQSIYRFRLARPELFMEKYEAFDSSGEGTDVRIDLFRNFRSRQEVLEFSNDIFYKIMQKDLGDVSYNEAAALYPGAAYPPQPGMQAEFLMLDTAEETVKELEAESGRKLEARMAAQRIRRLMRESHVTDSATGELRPIRYGDIVILLRSLKGYEEDFSEVLQANGIPVHVESSTGYFSAPEVQTLLCFLQLLDNPYQDIPMAAVLKSPIAGLDEEELAQIRVENREAGFAEAAYLAMQEAEEGKLADFYQLYARLREKVSDTPIHELILKILQDTGYGNYVAAMPAGKRRAANLDMLVEKAIAYEKTSYKGLFHFVRYIGELRKYDVDFGEADVTGENEDVVHIMTIHKSKGLEFPVVFVCGMGKRFNQTDAAQQLVVHPDLGLGLDEIRMQPRRRSTCLFKAQIADRIRRENLGEELRILYVAFTRAKEKLILTAAVNGWEKVSEGYVGNVLPKAPLDFTQRRKASCYMDWVVPAMRSYPGKYEITFVSAKEFVAEEAWNRAKRDLALRELMERIQAVPEEQAERLEKQFSWEYPNRSEAGRKSKYSVSELKHDSMLQKYDRELADAEIPEFLREEKEPCIPEFARRRNRETEEKEHLPVAPGALRGTAVHRVMECMDFEALLGVDRTDRESVKAFVRQQLEDMRKQGLITEEIYRLVPPSMIEAFVGDGIALRMARAAKDGNLFLERPFVMDHGGVLVQGIIDVFWLEEDRIVLLDYKTDRVKSGEELILRYQTQLELYADALRRIFTGSKAKKMTEEKVIYSFHLKEVIYL